MDCLVAGGKVSDEVPEPAGDPGAFVCNCRPFSGYDFWRLSRKPLFSQYLHPHGRFAQDRARRMIETSFRHRFVQALPQQQQNNTVEGPRAAGYRAPEADCMVVTAS